MIKFIDSFAMFYPCKPCASHFKKEIELGKQNFNKSLEPPTVENNKDLSYWFCRRHNYVNKWLNKPEFDCSFENLEKRWKKGFDHCTNVHKF